MVKNVPLSYPDQSPLSSIFTKTFLVASGRLGHGDLTPPVGKGGPLVVIDRTTASGCACSNLMGVTEILGMPLDCHYRESSGLLPLKQESYTLSLQLKQWMVTTYEQLLCEAILKHERQLKTAATINVSKLLRF